LFNAWQQKKHVAVMPIYWRLERLWSVDAQLREMDVSEPMREMERLQRDIYLARETIVLRGADLLTPNSESEAAHLQRDFGVPPERLRVSHYGTSAAFAGGDATRFRAYVDAEHFVLSVGQISSRKNQLNLIRALRDFPHPLVLLGGDEQEAYAEQCRAEAKHNRAPVYFIPRQAQHVAADAYASARVHAIVSIYDVGPLVALEAAVAGVPQVVTTECSMQNYLTAPTVFVDPEDLDAIRRGIEQVWNAPRDNALGKQLLQNFTWQRAAQELKTGLEWMLTQPRVEYNPFPELLRAQDLLEQQVKCLWGVVAAQTENARKVEQWAHELNAQLQAQRSFGARVKALVSK
jgi:glycosyltransferase involved in cell wall biosynthesis